MSTLRQLSVGVCVSSLKQPDLPHGQVASEKYCLPLRQGRGDLRYRDGLRTTVRCSPLHATFAGADLESPARPLMRVVASRPFSVSDSFAKTNLRGWYRRTNATTAPFPSPIYCRARVAIGQSLATAPEAARYGLLMPAFRTHTRSGSRSVTTRSDFEMISGLRTNGSRAGNACPRSRGAYCATRVVTFLPNAGTHA